MFEISTTPFSDSESDGELPKFEISAFKKYATSNSKKINTANFHNKSFKLSSSISAGKEYNKTSYINLNPGREDTHLQMQKRKTVMKKTLDESMRNNIVLQPEFAKLDQVPVFKSRRQIAKQARKDRDKTKGFNWFDMPAPEMTEEKKNDLLVVQMRQALDPKHFYKRSALKGNPKYFQVGTFVESPVEFYSSRVPRKERKQTLVDELLADAKFRKYQKKKYTEIQESQPKKYHKRQREKKTKLLEARVNSAKKNKKKKKK